VLRRQCCWKRWWPAAGVTLKSVATAIEVAAEDRPRDGRGAILDFRGNARRRQGRPRSASRKSVSVSMSNTSAPQDKLDLLFKTHRTLICVVYQTIKNGPQGFGDDCSGCDRTIHRRPGERRDPYSLSSRLRLGASTDAFSDGRRLNREYGGYGSRRSPGRRLGPCPPDLAFHPDARTAHGGDGRVRGFGFL